MKNFNSNSSPEDSDPHNPKNPGRLISSITIKGVNLGPVSDSEGDKKYILDLSQDNGVEDEPKEFRIAHKSPTGILGGGKEFMTREMAERWLEDTRKENPGFEVWVEDKNGNRREDF